MSTAFNDNCNPASRAATDNVYKLAEAALQNVRHPHAHEMAWKLFPNCILLFIFYMITFQTMNIAVSDEILNGVEITPQEAVLDFAVGLYSEGKVTLGRAAQVANATQSKFLEELGRRHIPIHYNMDDLQSDIQVVREH